VKRPGNSFPHVHADIIPTFPRLSATSGKAGGLRKVGRLKAAWPCGRSCRCSSQRRRRGIFVVVKRQPTKRRQARHLQRPYPEYAAPPELGDSPLDTATICRAYGAPANCHCSLALPVQNAPGNVKLRESSGQSRRVSYWTKLSRTAWGKVAANRRTFRLIAPTES
jgi:hypothetical protein